MESLDLVWTFPKLRLASISLPRVPMLHGSNLLQCPKLPRRSHQIVIGNTNIWDSHTSLDIDCSYFFSQGPIIQLHQQIMESQLWTHGDRANPTSNAKAHWILHQWWPSGSGWCHNVDWIPGQAEQLRQSEKKNMVGNWVVKGDLSSWFESAMYSTS